MATPPDRPRAHPAPRRSEAGIWLLLFGALGAPAAWSLDLVLNYGISTYPCFPHGVSFTRVIPGWGWSAPVVLAINIANLLVALLAGLVSLWIWRKVRGELKASGDVLDVGEGRTRWVATAGMMTGFGFSAAILFHTFTILTVPQCAGY